MLTICRTWERQMPEALNNKPGNPRNERRNANKAHKFESEGLERLGGEDSLPGTNRFLACQSPSFSLVTIVKLFGKETPLWHSSGEYQEERGGFTVVGDAQFKVHFPYLQQDELLGKTIKWNGEHHVSFSFFWRIPGHKKEWEVLIDLSGSALFYPICSKLVRAPCFLFISCTVVLCLLSQGMVWEKPTCHHLPGSTRIPRMNVLFTSCGFYGAIKTPWLVIAFPSHDSSQSKWPPNDMLMLSRV